MKWCGPNPSVYQVSEALWGASHFLFFDERYALGLISYAKVWVLPLHLCTLIPKGSKAVRGCITLFFLRCTPSLLVLLLSCTSTPFKSLITSLTSTPFGLHLIHLRCKGAHSPVLHTFHYLYTFTP